MKTKTLFRCKVCQYETSKWQGKCQECNSWNSFEEIVEDSNAQSKGFSITTKALSQPERLSEVIERIEHQKEARLYPFNSDLLNKFWNKGLAASSLTLLAGEPGLGKSTLSLQLLRSLYQGHTSDEKIKLLYITAEESVFELARRSKRLGIPSEIMVLQSNNFEHIEKVLSSEMPDVVVVDSVQTIYSPLITSNPGSVSQVATLAAQLLAISKSKNMSIILIGHVTKDGQIAGPKTLEHLVDSVLLLESSENLNYRTLSFSKHRFGSTSGMLLLKMEESGLEIVTDPSLELLENLESGVGVTYGLAMDKDMPVVVEVQALVAKQGTGGNFFGRREALGIKTAKLNTILAIAEKYLHLDLKANDIYIQLTGLPKHTTDESLDLPILLAIISSLREKPLSDIMKHASGKHTKGAVFAGRLTLSGKIRAATNAKVRADAAKKLGFEYNPNLVEGDLQEQLRGVVVG